MIKKEVTYVDYDNKTKTKTLRFNLNKLEYLNLLAELGDDLDVYIESLTKTIQKKSATNDEIAKATQEMLALITKILLLAYGEEHDGRFSKKDANGVRYAVAFEESEEYAELFVNLLENPKAAQDFFAKVTPQEVVKKPRTIKK